MYELSELTREIQVVCPVISVGGTQGNVSVQFDPSATPTQQTAAQSVISGFDWVNADRNFFRALAQADLSAGDGEYKLIRAVLLAILDELNRARVADGLAALTVAQAKQAVVSKITSGAAD